MVITRFNKTIVLAILFMSIGCSTFFYFPVKRELVYRHKLPIQPQDVEFKSSDGTPLHGWLFRAFDGKDPTAIQEPRAVIVHFHGNGQNLTTHFLSLYEAPAKGIAYLTFDYRGYGKSKGRPNPAGLVEDGVAAIRWMHQKYPGKPLIVFAQSLGGAVAFRSVNRIKKEVPIALLMIDSSFPDYRSAARDMFSRSLLTYIFQPLAWAAVNNSESPIEDIPQISPIPLVIAHGTKDRVIHHSLGRKIFELAKEPKEFWEIPGGEHLDLMFRNEGEYGDRFYRKVDQILGIRAPIRDAAHPGKVRGS